MKIARFDPPGNVGDLGNDEGLKGEYSKFMSGRFDVGVASVTRFLANEGGGTCQFYNPLTNGRSEPDLAASAGDIPWNGFPKRFLSPGPGQPTRFADAEPPPAAGRFRPQDEYLEWFVHRNGDQRITRVDFTCEGYDYYEDFLARHAEGALLGLYRQFVSPEVERDDLFVDGKYHSLNKWNTLHGAMHLTHQANNLFAEVFLAASATVRRRRPNGVEHTSALPLIRCAEFGAEDRNSDPNIGIAVNGLARERRMITLANPVGLYIGAFDGAGLTLDGQPAGGFFKVVRGAPPLGLRAVFELPPAAAAAGKTVSDVKSGSTPIEFGGQLAQRVTMHLVGIASVAQEVNNTPVRCGAIPAVTPPAPLALAAVPARPHLPTRTGE
jgi:hypothetical protein